jgi:hypothetical protein
MYDIYINGMIGFGILSALLILFGTINFSVEEHDSASTKFLMWTLTSPFVALVWPIGVPVALVAAIIALHRKAYPPDEIKQTGTTQYVGKDKRSAWELF